MTEVIRENNGKTLSLLRDEEGTYRVIADGEEIASTTVRALADVYYEECLEARMAKARETLARELEHRNLQAVRSDSFERRAAAAQKRGGRGGRGGV